MKKLSVVIQSVIISFFICSMANATDIMKKATEGGLRIELHVLEAEPFYTQDEVVAKNIEKGMLIMGGAQPVDLNDKSHPNHHLVIHVFEAKSDKVILNAEVKMWFQLLDKKGKPSGSMTEVPVVVMQVIGKGPESTHYGNNVVMPAGSYRVIIMVNKKEVHFDVILTDSSTGSKEEMSMKM